MASWRTLQKHVARDMNNYPESEQKIKFTKLCPGEGPDKGAAS